MPTILYACCLGCREIVVVSPPMRFGNVVIPEGAACPNCLLNATLDDITPSGRGTA